MKMNQKAAIAALILAGATAFAAGARAQDVNAGKQAFAECAACHSVTNANGVGPSLFGIIGRQSATVAGFHYSPAMKRAKKTWDDKTLDAYIANPQAVIPGNLMPFSGVADAKQRADLIAYLKTVK
jgi:cytochrome c